jgi:type IV pilus assembly protein PilP
MANRLIKKTNSCVDELSTNGKFSFFSLLHPFTLSPSKGVRTTFQQPARMLAAACAALLLFASVLPAQEVTPGQKTKEAMDKFSKIPSTVGQTIEEAAEKAKSLLKGNPAAKAPAQAEADNLTVPAKQNEPERPRYAPAGRRNPFRPAGLPAKNRRVSRENLSPLERYELGQLKLVGVVWDAQEPKAMVEDGAGLGYVVKVGTAIGSNDGKIKAINKNEIVIKETVVDFYGERKDREVTMRLPVE